MIIRLFITLLIFSFSVIGSPGQILHTESFSVILDTTKRIKGSVVPDFRFQNLKEDFFAFENTSDISFRIKKSAITIANKIELSKYGNEVLLSGGFLYIEYRKFFESKFILEPFSQFHWSEARGLEFKYAGGLNLRYRAHSSNTMGLYIGVGPFYEYERWNYDGVKDELIPMNAVVQESENIKLSTYLSLKWKTENNFDFDISLYHQSKWNAIFTSPRLASSSSIKYNFTEHLGLILQYQNIYDFKPLVPLDKLYNHIVFSVEVSF